MNCFINYVSCFSSLVALIIAIFYFTKPRLIITDETNDENIRIKCTNKNRSRLKIKDIKCDIVLSKNNEFDFTKTVKLRKNWIAGITHESKFYVFVSQNSICEFKDYEYMKVRILTINTLGVRKYHEKNFSLK